MSEAPPSDAAPEAGEPPRLGGIALGPRFAADDPDAARFLTGELLGAGGIGRVFSVEDRNLERRVAVKLLQAEQADPEAVAGLVAEARTTASLEHPGIVPVYDLDIGADGRVHYAMRRIHGRSLGSLVAEAERTGARPEPIADANPLVTILLKVCDALSYAHSRGVVHRDVKPDNIMLGEFGEVLVLDWGASSVLPRAGAGAHPSSGQFGTPAFMSPEQARGEAIDARSDVWSLGASLFNVLFLRFPFEDADPEAFWAGKRRGAVTPPAKSELHALNRPLAAIAMRAMRADPARRYQSVAAMAADLRAYQAGRAMTAYRGSPWERLRRWHLRWGRTLWITLAVGALLAAAGWFVWGERLKRIAAWGPPTVVEDFRGDGWRGRWGWRAADTFEVRDGRLISTAGTAAVAWLRRSFSGPVAIEFDGEITPGSRPCDLSVVWCDGPVDLARPDMPKRGWAIQTGAYDNSYCSISRIDDGRETQVARSGVRLETGRVYRIRAELDGSTVSLSIDGEPVLSYEDAVPIQPGHPGLRGFYPGKAFSGVRIYARGLAERISPLGIGDDSLYDGLYARAIERYGRVLASHPRGPLADEAWYKIGYCHRLAGDEAAAWAAWAKVVGPPARDRVACHELDRLFAAGAHDRLLAELPAVAGRSPQARAQAEGLWTKWMEVVRQDSATAAGRALMERYLATRRELFPGTGPSTSVYGYALNSLGRWERTLAECGDDPIPVTDALMCLGRPAEALRRFTALAWYTPRLRFQTGDLEGNLRDTDAYTRAWALGKLGRSDEALRENPGDWRPLAGTGRWQRILASDDEDAGVLARFALGRAEEAAAGAYHAKPHPSMYALALLGRQDALDRDGNQAWSGPALRLIARLAAGDRAGAAALRREVSAQTVNWSQPNAWFGPFVVAPFAALLDGDRAAWDRALEAGSSERLRAGQRLWHLAGFLRGTLSEEQVRAQPYRAEAEAWALLARGLRADAAGDATAAKEAYRAFRVLPFERRLLHDFLLDPTVERFVIWRLQAL